ncbi:hypothetical protein [Burkholderia ambifaria]|jgi:hypothetical protein|uniref:hypothetical protein n=1 Tax=Burkholderia ambifaria TaxID=152480 RepID=UPI001B94018A|nr:hypothetical protein [Burkholderia ambifaria]MBR8223476.1 hypothetical protein [Burkholderia ambifaria]
MAFIDVSRNDTDLTPNATAFAAYDDSNYQNGKSKFFESLKPAGLASSAHDTAWRRSFPTGEAGIHR